MLYTMWLRPYLGSIGEGVCISRPVFIEGGGQDSIKIGDHTFIGRNTILGCWKKYREMYYMPSLIIGNNCSIGEYCHITAINRITIGNGVLTGRFVFIGDNAHGGLSIAESNTPPSLRCLVSKGEITIGSNVWIGDKVSILGGVTVGDNVIIGTGSVVTHDLPANSMAAGIPARVIKQL